MKSILTKFISIVSFLSLILSITMISAQAVDDIHVQLDGQELHFDVPPQIINDRTMLPIRGVFEAMGATVQWDASTNTAIARKDDIIVSMTVGSNQFYYKSTTLKNNPHTMDTEVVNIDGRVLAPMRVVANILGYCVTWSHQNRTAYIETPKTTASGYCYNGTNVPTFNQITWQGLSDASINFAGIYQYTYRYAEDKKTFVDDDLGKYKDLLVANGWIASGTFKYSDYWTSYHFEKDDVKVSINVNLDAIENVRLYRLPYYISIVFADGYGISLFDISK